MKVVLCVALIFLGAQSLLGKTIKVDTEPEWWETASFYQIYPRSFVDSDADGIGDLNGITSKLFYLRESGIDATWLSPIFTSGGVDTGYDVVNFKEIGSEYGTMEDFEALIEEAKRQDIKIILDFVPNHSSDKHEWFIRSEDPSHPNHAEYKDFYVWHPGKLDSNGVHQFPNNWVSVFSGSAWTYSEKRGEYYLHQFDKGQPDLNFRNERVQKEMADVLTFWLEKGVYGFRVDAIPHLIEHADFPDESYGNEFTKDQPELYDIVFDWRDLLDAFAAKSDKIPRILMTEAYTDVTNTMKYFGFGGRKGAQIPFNFFMINNLRAESKAKDFRDAIMEWMDNMPAGKTANWVLGNHDQSRLANRVGPPAKADGINMLLRLLPGAAITYQGEEIAMENVAVSYADSQDPQVCNLPETPDYLERSRDRARTPFQWNSSPNAGFSTNRVFRETWLPLADDFDIEDRNLSAQKLAARSHYKVFLKLSKARKSKTFQTGDFELAVISENVFAFVRTLDGHESFAVILNLGIAATEANLKGNFAELPEFMEVYVASVASDREEGSKVATEAVELAGYEALVLYG